MSPFTFDSLALPVVQAPMAGGPSGPGLAAAVSRAGALGSLAAGYLTSAATAETISTYRSLTDAPVSVNVFVPEQRRAALADLESYRQALVEWTVVHDIAGDIPVVPDYNDDEFDEKIVMLCEVRPDVVTFTFGLPDRTTIERLQDSGIRVGVTVTSEDEGRAAEAHGADFLIAQGIEAGGHRGQFDQSAAPLDITAPELVRVLVAAVGLPVVGAGGVDGADSAQAVLDAGACAVQIGTLFLTTEEAGTKPTHRAALLRAATEETDTVLTRVFTGRPARALSNRFTSALGDRSVIGYPQVHFLTAGIRAAAASADEPELLNLWAGTGYRGCRQETAAALLARFSALTANASVQDAAPAAPVSHDAEGSVR